MIAAALALVLAITPHAMRAHVNFLASDAVEGREAGTRGYDVAAAYVAAQFEAVGAEPAGDGGTYFQQVRMRTFLLDPAKSSFAIDGKTFEHRKDVLISPGLESTSEVDAPVVFAGFGIVAPELGHDDYANIDVRGKIVAMLAGAPPRFPHSQRAYYSSGTVKSANARGARRDRHRSSSARSTPSAASPGRARIATGESVGMRALDRNGTADGDASRSSAAAPPSDPPPRRRSSPGERTTLDAILAGAEKGIAQPFALKKRVAIRATTAIGKAHQPERRGDRPRLRAARRARGRHRPPRPPRHHRPRRGPHPQRRARQRLRHRRAASRSRATSPR